MGLARSAFIGLGVIVLLSLLGSRFSAKLPVHIDGHVEKGFELVEQTFRFTFFLYCI